MTPMAIYLIIILVAGFFKGLKDQVAFHGLWSNHRFWGMNNGTNKWKNGDKNQGERFFGSSTFLVFMTDGFHLLQAMEYLCLFVVMASNPVWDRLGDLLVYVLYRLIFGIGFWITYKLLKK